MSLFSREPEVEAAEEPLSARSANDLLASPKCRWCGGYHSTIPACRRVRRLRDDPATGATEVWFWPDGAWDESGIIWPDTAAEALERAEKKESPE